jgi:hypothetical protein
MLVKHACTECTTHTVPQRILPLPFSGLGWWLLVSQLTVPCTLAGAHVSPISVKRGESGSRPQPAGPCHQFSWLSAAQPPVQCNHCASESSMCHLLARPAFSHQVVAIKGQERQNTHPLHLQGRHICHLASWPETAAKQQVSAFPAVLRWHPACHDPCPVALLEATLHQGMPQIP